MTTKIAISLLPPIQIFRDDEKTSFLVVYYYPVKYVFNNNQNIIRSHNISTSGSYRANCLQNKTKTEIREDFALLAERSSKPREIALKLISDYKTTTERV